MDSNNLILKRSGKKFQKVPKNKFAVCPTTTFMHFHCIYNYLYSINIRYYKLSRDDLKYTKGGCAQVITATLFITAILCKGHLQILLSVGILGPVPCTYRGSTLVQKGHNMWTGSREKSGMQFVTNNQTCVGTAQSRDESCLWSSPLLSQQELLHLHNVTIIHYFSGFCEESVRAPGMFSSVLFPSVF